MADKRTMIKKAFIEMIGKMPIESVRTEELLKRAEVSKTTFYRTFRDKYDVMNSVYMDVSSQMVERTYDLANWKEWTLHDLENVKAHKTFFRNIISYEGQNSFQEVTGHFFQTNMLRQVRNREEGREPSEEIRFLVEAFARVNVFTLVWWIRGDCQVPPDRVVEYVEESIPPRLRKYFEPEPEAGSAKSGQDG